MEIRIKLSKLHENIIDEAIKNGLAVNKEDALHLAVLQLDNKYKLLENGEDIEKRYEAGKNRKRG